MLSREQDETVALQVLKVPVIFVIGLFISIVGVALAGISLNENGGDLGIALFVIAAGGLVNLYASFFLLRACVRALAKYLLSL